MGHVLNYTLGDVVTHFRRRHGFTVLRPMGFDSFGLPAENAAIKDGGHPLEITERNMATIRHQMRRMGWAIDWQREVSAHEPTFYRWTQWLFLKFFEHGLAYRKEAPVNWCPNDQTVLANEHVVDGRCWRCGAIVEARNMAQWFFKITAYADALLDDLATIDWPERTKKIQTNWIGRSEGAEVLFRVDELDIDIPVFTTRPDTLFGATFFVIAPESPLVEQLVAGPSRRRGAARTRASPRARPTEEREQREKTRRLHRPLRDEPGQRRADPDLGRRLRADGVRHRRDHGGAGARRARRASSPRRYDLPVVPVIDDDGTLDQLRRSSTAWPRRTAKRAIVEWLERAAGRASRRSTTACATGASRGSATGAARSRSSTATSTALVPVPEDELPVLLPEVEDYRPKGQPPLASNAEFINAPCPICGGPGTPRGRHDGHVRRLVLVLPALHAIRRTTRRRSTARSPTTGCRSTSTSAGSITRRATCSTRASSSRC